MAFLLSRFFEIANLPVFDIWKLYRRSCSSAACFNSIMPVVDKANAFDCCVIDNVKPLLNGCISCNGQIAIYGSVTVNGRLTGVNCDVLRGCDDNIAVR